MAELPLPAGLDASTFPAKLWRLANSPRVRSVRWDSQARGLLIDRSLFERELLSPAGAHGAGGEGAGAAPHTFKATHFGSIVRQLNLYGFRKVPARAGAAVPGGGRAWLHYRNASFRRDRPDLLLRIERRSAASRQRVAARREGRSRLQQLRRAAPSRQKRCDQWPGDSELPRGPSRRSAGAQESEASPPPAKKACATTGLLRSAPVEPSRELIRKFKLRKVTIPLVRMDLKRHPELMVRLTRIDPEAACRALRGSSSCTPSEQHPPASDPSAPSRQNLGAASPEDSELPRGPSRTSPGPQELQASPAAPEKVPSGLLGLSSEQPGTHEFQLQPELLIQPVPVEHQGPSVALPESSSCTAPELQAAASSPSGTLGTSGPDSPPGSAGYPAWTIPSWVWKTPGEEELPPLDLDLVLETLEEMFSCPTPERSPFAQDNTNVGPESSGGQAVSEAAAEGALPSTESSGNTSQEPEELDIHLIYLARRAALRASKDPRESL